MADQLKHSQRDFSEYANLLTNNEQVERIRKQTQENDRFGGCSQAVLLSLQDEFGIGNNVNNSIKFSMNAESHIGHICIARRLGRSELSGDALK